MPTNFFEYKCKTQSTKSEFGLCDDIPNSPAYINETNKEKWIGIVKNPDEKFVEFYAIDNCVNLRREDDTQESRCDGVLKESDNLIFVELKERRSSGWFSDGKKQLENTISIFRRENNVLDFESISAYVCNNLKPHSNAGRAVSMQKFKDETGFILRDTMEIFI